MDFYWQGNDYIEIWPLKWNNTILQSGRWVSTTVWLHHHYFKEMLEKKLDGNNTRVLHALNKSCTATDILSYNQYKY